MARLFVIGEALADIVNGRVIPGGSSFNTALAAKRAGLDVVFFDLFSTDEYGRLLAGTARANGIEIPSILLGDPRPSTQAYADIDADGNASYRFITEGTATMSLSEELLGKAMAEYGEPDAIAVGSISLACPPGADAIAKTIASMAGKAFLFFDPNVRPTIISDMPAYFDRIDGITRAADLVKMSDEDAALIYGSCEDCRELLRPEKTVFVITRGADGAHWSGGGEIIHIPSFKVNVADSIGAGDTFSGAMLARLADFGFRKDLSPSEIRDVLTFAGAAAAINCTRVGCDPPLRSEIEEFLRREGS